MNKRHNSFAPTALPPPLMDGCTPVFVESGSDPTVAPGFDLPMGSMLRFGVDYYEKTGPGAVDWTLYPPASAQDWFRVMRIDDAGAAYVNTQRLNFASYQQGCPGDSGLGFGVAIIYNGLAGADRYMAIPDYFPTAGAIRRLSFFAQRATMQVAARIQLHVYSDGICNTSPFVGYHYPDQLLASGTLFQPSSQGVAVGPGPYHVYDSLMNLAVDGGTVLWFVWRSNQAANEAGSKFSIARGNFAPWMGFVPGAAAVNDTVGCGWHHTQTFTSGAAQTFPQTAPGVLVCGGNVSQTDMPAIGYGFLRD